MIIYAIKIEDVKTSSVLNFIKYLCAPNSKTEIHLSVQGPFKTKLDSKKVEELNRIIKNAVIKVNEVGNFFLYGQNTVYLKCVGDIIRRVWSKKDYAYMPHLTLYDGDNEDFAFELYSLLKNLPIELFFNASSLVIYDTEKLRASTLLTLGINNDIMNSILGMDWRSIDPTNCTTEEKLELIKKCFMEINLNHAVSYSPVNQDDAE